MRALRNFFALLLVASICSPAAIIKTGDMLEIKVQGHADFSGTYTVNEKGTIEYPLLADVAVINYSTAELMNDLTFRLARHVENPLVLISVVDNPEMAVVVLGNVMKPGPVKLYQGASVQEAIMAAGGPAEKADIARVKIVHKGGNDETARFYNLRAFLQTGGLTELPVLEPDDLVVLLAEERNKTVKVIGAVSKPGFFTLEDSLNVFELIYLAGGPAENADLSRVRRFYRGDGGTREEVLNIQSFIDRGKMDDIPAVSEGDVVIVYARWFDYKTMFTVLNNVLLFIVTIQALRGAFDK